MIKLIAAYEGLSSLLMALALGVGLGATFLLLFGVTAFLSHSPSQVRSRLRKRDWLAAYVVWIVLFAGGMMTFIIGIASFERFGIGSGFEAVIVPSIAIVTIFLGVKLPRAASGKSSR